MVDIENTSRDELIQLIRQLLERISQLEMQLAEKDRIIEDQAKRIAKLENELEKARKNSSNSSKPPSSDIVKPSRPKSGDDETKRKIGAQPGHIKYARKPFPPEKVDIIHEHILDRCPTCGSNEITPTDMPPRIQQQIEIPEKLFHVIEHRGHAYLCGACGKIHHTKIETEGILGERLSALIGYMKGCCHASYSTIRQYLADVFGISLSRGLLSKTAGKIGASLSASYEELLARLPKEPVLNVDETGHKDNGARLWTWCFRAGSYGLFSIDKSRGSDVLTKTLGKEFGGVLCSDYFSAYRKYSRENGVSAQYCLAHLIRDLKYLAGLPDKATAAYGERILAHVKALFGVIHRRDEVSVSDYEFLLKTRILSITAGATNDVPASKEAIAISRRFIDSGDGYFQFAKSPGVSPTNNIAEQTIRFVVISRLVTQGTRSEIGRRFCERVWTTLATCAMQGRSAFEFILSALKAHIGDGPAPSLLTNTS